MMMRDMDGGTRSLPASVNALQTTLPTLSSLNPGNRVRRGQLTTNTYQGPMGSALGVAMAGCSLWVTVPQLASTSLYLR